MRAARVAWSVAVAAFAGVGATLVALNVVYAVRLPRGGGVDRALEATLALGTQELIDLATVGCLLAATLGFATWYRLEATRLGASVALGRAAALFATAAALLAGVGLSFPGASFSVSHDEGVVTVVPIQGLIAGLSLLPAILAAAVDVLAIGADAVARGLIFDDVDRVGDQPTRSAIALPTPEQEVSPPRS